MKVIARGGYRVKRMRLGAVGRRSRRAEGQPSFNVIPRRIWAAPCVRQHPRRSSVNGGAGRNTPAERLKTAISSNLKTGVMGAPSSSP